MVTWIGRGAPAPYANKAVKFDGATSLRNTNLIAPVSPFVAWSVWMRHDTPSWGNSFYCSGNAAYDYFDPDNNQYWVSVNGETIGQPGVSGGVWWWCPPELAPALGPWHHFLSAIRADQSPPIPALYIDDVPISLVEGVTKQTTGTAPWAWRRPQAGKNCGIGTDFQGDYWIGDMFDLWLASDVNIVELDGTISVANRRKFITAGKKPVDPANFPAGGSVLLSGDATSFINNQLGGGAFAIYEGALTDATTSPSD